MQVSVVIPTFNRAYCIKRAIMSALSQGVYQTEVIVIDDGSEDDTESVVGNIVDARLKYIKKTNGGVSSARNVGLDVATGSLLAFLDSDDYWPENYLEKMVSALEAHPQHVLAYCMTAYVKSDGSLLNSFPVERCKSGSVTQDLFAHHFVTPSGTVIRSNSIKDLRFDESLTNMEDPDFFLRLSLKGDFRFVDEIKVPRTDSPGSLSKGLSENALFVRERFYFELGGKDYIARDVAFRKLSRICVRLGKKFHGAGNYSKARELFFKSIKYNPYNARAYLYLVASTARSLF
jgi:glycosyltransferase involved in cell wall biosynthesis